MQAIILALIPIVGPVLAEAIAKVIRLTIHESGPHPVEDGLFEIVLHYVKVTNSLASVNSWTGQARRSLTFTMVKARLAEQGRFDAPESLINSLIELAVMAEKSEPGEPTTIEKENEQ